MNEEFTDAMWEQMLNKIGDTEHEIQTVPMSENKIGVWFTVRREGNAVVVSEGKTHEPKSTKQKTRIRRDEFARVYPIYVKRCNGKSVSGEAKQATRNQVYIYAIFENFLN